MTSVARIPQVQSPGRRPQPLSGRRYPVQGSDTRAMPPEADRGRHVDVAQAMPPAGGRQQPPRADSHAMAFHREAAPVPDGVLEEPQGRSLPEAAEA